MKNVKFSRNGVEFEPTKQELKIVLDDFAKQLAERDKKIADLEAKLAEKENELEEVKQTRTQILNFGKRTKKVVIANPYGEDCVVYNQEDQDKISFAVEQLEKVKYEVKHYGYEFSKSMHEFIDNQIKELKGKENV